jgi:para-nitrobenzyl esterase
VVEATVQTRQGRARGVELDGVVRFAGLPYAVAPDPSSPRFSWPVPPPAWSGVRDASGFGAVAPQSTTSPGYLPGEAAVQDEECRSVNVWAPLGPAERLPVLVFVHGGAFLAGAGSSRLYDGAALARHGAVVVTFNYRLGALGFLAHEALRLPGGSCGNWGLADQLAALAWVGDHAAAFGGDPGNVTVFGESAGAMSICDLLGTPAARGRFRRAVVQSGFALARPLSTASALTETLCDRLGVAPERSALAGVPLDALVEAQQSLSTEIDEGLGMPFAPVVDGHLFARHPADLVAAGGGAGPVDVLAGTNRDEFNFFTFVASAARDVDAGGLEGFVGRYLRSAGLQARVAPGEVTAAYVAARSARGEPAGPGALLDAFGTDFLFRIPLVRLLEAHGAAGGRCFAYRFDWASPFAGGRLGACHALELPFVFGTVGDPLIGAFSGNGPAAVELSSAVREAWVAFAASGDPSTDRLGRWPAYEPSRRATMVLDTAPALVDDPGGAERAFWAARLGRYGAGGPVEGAEPEGVAFLGSADRGDSSATGAA